MSLTTVHGVEVYLNRKKIDFKSIETVTTGTANFVYRVLTDEYGSFIIKHAEPYVKVHPAIPFPVSRLAFEAEALATIPDSLKDQRDSGVRLPKLDGHDRDEHVLRMQDAGRLTLKEAYIDREIDMPTIGTRLGGWLAALHYLPSTKIKDNVAAKVIYRHCYAHLSSRLESFGLDSKFGEIVNETYGSLLSTDDDCVCHGDFWTGNILIEKESKEPHTTAMLTVADWEMVRRGCGATDVGQFAAESWLLEHFRGKRGLCEAFLKAYYSNARPQISFSKRVAIHFGTHLAYWTAAAGWADEIATREVVVYGLEVLKRANEEDWEWLKANGLGSLIL